MPINQTVLTVLLTFSLFSTTKPAPYWFIHHTVGGLLNSLPLINFACDGGSDCYDALQEVQEQHMDDRGYVDVGYKYIPIYRMLLFFLISDNLNLII